MDCAPFKKPSRKAGLFSYRSVIPPSPHETLLRKFPRGPRPPCGRPYGAAYRLRRLFCFTKSSSRAYSAAPRFPTKLCLCKFPRGPRRPVGGHAGRRIPCGGFFCKSHRALIPLRLLLPTKFCLRKFPRGPRPPCGRSYGVDVSLATSFFVSQKAHRALTLLLLVSPRNFASQISAGAPPPCERPCGGGASLAATFLQKSPRAHSAAAPSPHEILLTQISAGTPAALRAVIRGRRIACDELFCFTKSSSRAHSAAPRFPTKLCFAKFHGGPAASGAAKRKRRIPCGGFLLCVPPAS